MTSIDGKNLFCAIFCLFWHLVS